MTYLLTLFKGCKTKLQFVHGIPKHECPIVGDSTRTKVGADLSVPPAQLRRHRQVIAELCSHPFHIRHRVISHHLLTEAPRSYPGPTAVCR